MDIEEVKRRIEEVERFSSVHDDEVAHSKEDDLHQAVLRHIADHCSDLECRELAIAALKTIDLKFSRWCA
jgi:hypothetical protein